MTLPMLPGPRVRRLEAVGVVGRAARIKRGRVQVPKAMVKARRKAKVSPARASVGKAYRVPFAARGKARITAPMLAFSMRVQISKATVKSQRRNQLQSDDVSGCVTSAPSAEGMQGEQGFAKLC